MGKPFWCHAEALLWALLVLVITDYGVHHHAELRTAYDFRPSSAHGDLNDDINVWMSLFSARVRALPFRETFHFANPWDYYIDRDGVRKLSHYTSHPPLLTFALAATEEMAGPGPLTVRRFALALFALRIFFLFALVARTHGTSAARLACLLYLAVPATQEYPHALLFEVTGGTLVLGAFWALGVSRALAAALAVLAVSTEWTCLLFTPFLAFAFDGKRWRLGVFTASLAAVAAEVLWMLHLPAAAGQGGSLAYHLYFYVKDAIDVLDLVALWRNGLWRQWHAALPWFVAAPAAYALLRHRREITRTPWTALTLGGLALTVLFFPAFRLHAYMSNALILGILPMAALGWQRWFHARPAFTGAGALLSLVTALTAHRYVFHRAADAALIDRYRRESLAGAAIIGERSFFLRRNESELAASPFPYYALEARQMQSPSRDFLGQEQCAAFNVIEGPDAPACANLYAGQLLRVTSGACLCPKPGAPEYRIYRASRSLRLLVGEGIAR